MLGLFLNAPLSWKRWLIDLISCCCCFVVYLPSCWLFWEEGTIFKALEFIHFCLIPVLYCGFWHFSLSLSRNVSWIELLILLPAPLSLSLSLSLALVLYRSLSLLLNVPPNNQKCTSTIVVVARSISMCMHTWESAVKMSFPHRPWPDEPYPILFLSSSLAHIANGKVCLDRLIARLFLCESRAIEIEREREREAFLRDFLTWTSSFYLQVHRGIWSNSN